jgi:hypothetical protein
MSQAPAVAGTGTRLIVPWMGTLEDALVAGLALRLRLPARTLNDRDLSAFPRLELWAPDASS